MVDDESSQKPKFGAKSDFVRSLDPGLPAGQVVALAEKQGLKLTPGFVYNIRSMASGRANASRSSAAKSGRAASSPKPSRAEALLRAAIAEVGLAKARQILEEVEATFAGLR
jgi:hypothetical protein